MSFFTDLLQNLLQNNELFFYIGMGLIIFVETGIVIFPFLPGDSILFFAGSLAAMNTNNLSIVVLIVLLTILAFLANVLNFTIGRNFEQWIVGSPRFSKFLKQKHLDEAHAFFEKYGSFAIFLGRFMPIVRTVVPFVAGGSNMTYRKFMLHNFLGGFTWVFSASIAGYFLGKIPFVEKHFEIIMVAIILVSLLPAVVVALKRKSGQRQLKK